MSQHKRICPFLKSKCIECPVYRGRHAHLWAPDLSIRPRIDRLHNNGSDPINALHTFLDDVTRAAGIDSER